MLLCKQKNPTKNHKSTPSTTPLSCTGGFLYEWDNGDRESALIERKVRSVSYEPMDEAA